MRRIVIDIGILFWPLNLLICWSSWLLLDRSPLGSCIGWRGTVLASSIAILSSFIVVFCLIIFSRVIVFILSLIAAFCPCFVAFGDDKFSLVSATISGSISRCSIDDIRGVGGSPVRVLCEVPWCNILPLLLIVGDLHDSFSVN